ncbi:MAG: polysaccharide deacetylase family protein, partial [Candidatus Acidiferrales bacterium]
MRPVALLGMLLLALPLWAAEPSPRELAITIDDLPIGGPTRDLETVQRINARMLEVLAAHKAPAIGFVNEGRVEVEGEAAARTAILESWLDAGLPLGNHTYSHWSFHDTPLQRFTEDILRGEVITRRLMEARSSAPGYFRHPFTRTGPDAEAKAALEKFLAEHGYRVAPFTIENADYAFNVVYLRARTAGDDALAGRTRAAYLDFTDAMFNYFERFAADLFARDIRQVLLIHVNALNADCLDEMLSRLERRGYRFVSLDRALEDPAYASPETYVGRMGLSWLHR